MMVSVVVAVAAVMVVAAVVVVAVGVVVVAVGVMVVAVGVMVVAVGVEGTGKEERTVCPSPCSPSDRNQQTPHDT